jgi:hypothetical protein
MRQIRTHKALHFEGVAQAWGLPLGMAQRKHVPSPSPSGSTDNRKLGLWGRFMTAIFRRLTIYFPPRK